MSGVIFFNMGIEVRENNNFHFLEVCSHWSHTPTQNTFGYFRMKAMSSFVDNLFEVVVGF